MLRTSPPERPDYNPLGRREQRKVKHDEEAEPQALRDRDRRSKGTPRSIRIRESVRACEETSHEIRHSIQPIGCC